GGGVGADDERRRPGSLGGLRGADKLREPRQQVAGIAAGGKACAEIDGREASGDGHRMDRRPGRDIGAETLLDPRRASALRSACERQPGPRTLTLYARALLAPKEEDRHRAGRRCDRRRRAEDEEGREPDNEPSHGLSFFDSAGGTRARATPGDGPGCLTGATAAAESEPLRVQATVPRKELA